MMPVASLEELEEFLGEKLDQFERGPPMAHQGLRLSHVCKQVQLGILSNNASAVRIACWVITEDPSMPFGKCIKSDFARALRQRVHLLSRMQRRDLAAKTCALLALEFCPRETEDYCKLIKKFVPSELLPWIAEVRASDEKSRSLLERLISEGP